MSQRQRRTARSRSSLPVYLLPCRIQQGWGDVEELARAAWSLHKAGFPLVYLEPGEGDGPGRGPDRRALPVDPRDAGPIRFPPHRRLSRPSRTRRAIALVTWWGISARARDELGGPLPGGVATEVARLARAYPDGRLLHVSLEEFGSDQTSDEAIDEGLRQAGWGRARRRRAMASPQGRAQVERFHRAFELARAGERGEVLHLTGTFHPDGRSLGEFPFLLPVLPFQRGPDARLPPTAPPYRRAWPKAPPPRSLSVMWYASPSSSEEFARARLVPALGEIGLPLTLEVRAPPGRFLAGWARQVPSNVRLRVLRELEPKLWWTRWWDADLRIASGSQTLVACCLGARPFLYFNGFVVGGSGRSWAFRREKLLSLLRALRVHPGGEALARDLESFADGREVGPILRRAMTSPSWRRRTERALQAVSSDLVSLRGSGDELLVEVASRFATEQVGVLTLVREVRRAWSMRSGGSPRERPRPERNML